MNRYVTQQSFVEENVTKIAELQPAFLEHCQRHHKSQFIVEIQALYCQTVAENVKTEKVQWS